MGFTLLDALWTTIAPHGASLLSKRGARRPRLRRPGPPRRRLPNVGRLALERLAPRLQRRAHRRRRIEHKRADGPRWAAAPPGPRTGWWLGMGRRGGPTVVSTTGRVTPGKAPCKLVAGARHPALVSPPLLRSLHSRSQTVDKPGPRARLPRLESEQLPEPSSPERDLDALRLRVVQFGPPEGSIIKAVSSSAPRKHSSCASYPTM